MAAKAVQDVRNAIAKLTERENEIHASNREMDEYRKQASHGAVNLHQILDAQRFQMLLLSQAQQLDQTLGELGQELQRRELKLLRCQQNVKSLEKLKEHREDEAERLLWSKQQERTDEWASVRFATQIQSDDSHEVS